MENLLLSTAKTWIILGVLVAFLIALYVYTHISGKKQKEKMVNALNNLKIGDKVTTIGGVKGEVVELDEETFVIKTGTESNYSFMRFVRNAIYSFDSAEVEVVEENVAVENEDAEVKTEEVEDKVAETTTEEENK